MTPPGGDAKRRSYQQYQRCHKSNEIRLHYFFSFQLACTLLCACGARQSSGATKLSLGRTFHTARNRKRRSSAKEHAETFVWLERGWRAFLRGWIRKVDDLIVLSVEQTSH